MQDGPEAIVDAFYAAWILRDIETVAAYFSDNFRLSQHFSDPMLPFTGETIGKAAALARLQMILDEWRFLKFEPTLTVADGTSVRTTCPFILQHLRTGEIFDGSFAISGVSATGNSPLSTNISTSIGFAHSSACWDYPRDPRLIDGTQ